jgi:hypothetical protein
LLTKEKVKKEGNLFLFGFSEKPKEIILKGHGREANDFWLFFVLG